METIEVSPQFKTTSTSLPSPTATHVASLSGSRLQIRCLFSLEIVRSIALPQSHDVRNSRLAWSSPALPSYATSTPPRRSPAARSSRVLVADDETTRIYDLRDEKWSAIINNGSGGMGKNVHVEFGRTEDEVVVFSDFASKATVWCLRTGRTVEIKDPKYPGKDGKGWGYRPAIEASGRRGILAMLCRSAGQDTLLLLAPKSYEMIKKVELPTIDAAGLKWSRDGRWIVTWDSAALGYSLHVYTADGHLYRTISREPSDEINEWGVEGLGIKSVDWVPGNQWLAVGGWDRRVRILSTKTFSPVVYLDHTSQIHVPGAQVYTEQVDGRGFRSYSLTQQPVTPPKAATEKGDNTMKQGISVLAFNKDGTMCATRDDSTPTTIWIWDLRALQPKTILIQHSPAKSLQWHPSNSSCLLIQSTHDFPTLYLYTAPSLSSSTSTSFTAGPPEILDLSDSLPKPAGSSPVRWVAKWLATSGDKKPSLIVSHQQSYIVAWPQGKDQILRFENEDGNQSDDSLYDILTGRTPVPRLHHDNDEDEMRDDGRDMEDSGEFEGVEVEAMKGEMEHESSGSFEDTFRERRRGVTVKRGGSRGKSVFDESGMSEMF